MSLVRSCPTTAIGTKPLLVETYPHRVPEHLRPLIKQTDMVHDFGDMKLYRARREHMVLMKKPLEDFVKNEPTDIGAGCRTNDELTWPLLFNCTRYPYSFFTLNNNHEVVNIVFQEVIYKDPAKDLHPRTEVAFSDPRDPFNLVGPVLDWVDKRCFEITGADKMLNNEIVFTPSVLRGQRIAGRVHPVVMKNTVEKAVSEGIKWSMGVATGRASVRNFAKMGYHFPEAVPEEMYKDFDGKPWLPYNEGPGQLFLLDMEIARDQKLFG